MCALSFIRERQCLLCLIAGGEGTDAVCPLESCTLKLAPRE
jgi:hypothetical protein